MTARTTIVVGLALGLVGSARAERRVGLLVAPQSAKSAQVAAAAAAWLAAHRSSVDSGPLAGDALASLQACMAINDAGCARTVVTRDATTPEVLWVQTAATGEDIRIDVFWFRRDGEPVAEGGTCMACRDDKLRGELGTVLASAAARVAPSTNPPAVAAPPAMPPTIRAEAATPSAPRRVHVGIEAGAEIPRRALDAGPLIAGRAAYALDTGAAWQVEAAVDYVRTGHESTALLAPTWFPRSAGDLADHTDLITIEAGGSVRLARLGDLELRAALQAGLELARATFTAYGMSRDDSGVAAVATAGVALVGPAGPVRWRGSLGWRESRRDLGAASMYGEEITSGGLLAFGIEW